MISLEAITGSLFQASSEPKECNFEEKLYFSILLYLLYTFAVEVFFGGGYLC